MSDDADRVPNRQLTAAERDTLFAPLIADVGEKLTRLSAGGANLLWALRRKLAKELVYMERSKPAQRKALKAKKIKEQGGLCPECRMQLPLSDNVLDRTQAMAGYTAENTRLICRACDTSIQSRRRFT